MASEELLRKLKNGSLMDSGKMDSCMDIAETFFKMVNAMSLSFKMVKKLEISDFDFH